MSLCTKSKGFADIWLCETKGRCFCLAIWQIWQCEDKLNKELGIWNSLWRNWILIGDECPSLKFQTSLLDITNMKTLNYKQQSLILESKDCCVSYPSQSSSLEWGPESHMNLKES